MTATAASVSVAGRNDAPTQPTQPRAGARGERTSALFRALGLLCGGAFLVPFFGCGVQLQTMFAFATTLFASFVLWREGRRRGGDLAVPWTPTTLGALLLFAASLLSVLVAPVKGAALYALMMPAMIALLHVAGLMGVSSPRELRSTALLGLGAGAIVASFGLVGCLRYLSAIDAGTAIEAERTAFLATPFFPHSYIAAQALLPLVPLGLALALFRSTLLYRGLALLFLLPTAAYIGVVMSRGLWLALVFSCGVVVIGALHAALAERHRGVLRVGLRLLLIALLVAALGSLLWVRFLPALLDEAALRVRTLFAAENAWFNFARLMIWEDALRMSVDHLPLGVGAGQFAIVLPSFHADDHFVSHAHNQWIQVLAETGPAGLIGWLLLALHPLVLAARAWRRALARPQLAGCLLGSSAALVALLVCSAFETPLLGVPGVLGFALLPAAIVRLALRSAPQLVPVRRLRGDDAGRARRRFGLGVLGVFLLLAPVAASSVLGGVYAWRGERRLAQGDCAGAIPLAERGRDLAPHLDWPNFVLAEACRRNRDFAAADLAYERQESIVPGVAEVLEKHAQVLAQLDRPLDAYEKLAEARRRAPRDELDSIDFELANALTRCNRNEEARALYVGLLMRGFQTLQPSLLRKLAENCLFLERDLDVAAQYLDEWERTAPDYEPATREKLRLRVSARPPAPGADREK